MDSSSATNAKKAGLASHGVTASVSPSFRSLDRCSVLPPDYGSLRGKAYASAKTKISELSVHLDQLVGDYDEDVCTRDRELSEVRKANVALQSRVVELTERNRVLESDALSGKRRDEEWSAKLKKISSKRAKDKEEITSLKSQLSTANDLRDARVNEAITRARDEVSRGFAGRVSEVATLLTEIDGKAKTDMLDLTEVDANLEFIELFQKPKRATLEAAEDDLFERQAPIYDARDVFAQLIASVRQVLEISEVAADDEGDGVGDEDDDDEEDDEADD